MRKLALICVVWGLAGMAYGQQPESTGPDEKVDHLLKAAAHLEAAGQTDKAQEVLQLVEEETQALRDKLQAMEAELARLRRPTGTEQQVRVEIQMLEISRTKMRRLGFDFSRLQDGQIVTTNAKVPGTAGTFQIINQSDSLMGMLKAMRKDGLVKVLAQPTICSVSGRPATFKCGNELPAPLLAGDDSQQIHSQHCGIEVQMVATVLENGRIRLGIRSKLSELAPHAGTKVSDRGIPAVRVRQVETGVEMQDGQTLVLGGIVQTRAMAKSGQDNTKQQKEEVELLLLVTPTIVKPPFENTARVKRATRYAPQPVAESPHLPPINAILSPPPNFRGFHRR